MPMFRLLVIFLGCGAVCSLPAGKDQKKLTEDWNNFINEKSIKQYSGKDLSSRFADGIFEGDIMGIEDGTSIADLKSAIKDVYTDSSTRWQRGSVPYNFTEKFDKKEKTFILRVMQMISSSTGKCITFIPRTVENDYILFVRGFSCFSLVGRQGNNQAVSLATGCLENMVDAAHVILHALGFFHENARLDRDKFITINEENVASGKINEFQKYIDASSAKLPYDVESVLHYPFNVFAEDPTLPTIIPTKEGSKIGQTDGLTELDIKKIRMAYSCAKPGEPAPQPPKSAPTEKPPPKHHAGTTVKPTEAPDSADVTPDTPDVTTTEMSGMTQDPFMTLFPDFKMLKITPEQCQALNTKNCKISTASQNCKDGAGFIASCSSQASNEEVLNFFTKLQKQNASRGLEITLHGKRRFKRETFEPVEGMLIILNVADYDGFKLSFFRDLQLPYITHIGIGNSNGITIKQDDLLFFPKITMIILKLTTVKEIETGAFDNLAHLDLVTFDTGYNSLKTLTSAQKDHLRLLHCDCKYSWLRTFVANKPDLVAPKATGRIHRFGGIISDPFKLRDIFLPVDCAKDSLVGSSDQTDFSINVPSCDQ